MATLNTNQRCELAAQVYRAVYETTESIEDLGTCVNALLVYLLGSIVSDSIVCIGNERPSDQDFRNVLSTAGVYAAVIEAGVLVEEGE
ncbi:hypothetical protein K0504_18095 [Neiella marina]|uniref:Uncharacterized protein n=1 Tax=Neiella holothuriorum TaxID=2870530 RepID=A0ABS7EKQ6_9GAMM|nr:hypothetical protein [Neiella holothuriorum]MBW8192947.1 hypothetical protein [Neiella holothuriorum]